MPWRSFGKTSRGQMILVGLFVLIASVCQILLFKARSNFWIDVLRIPWWLGVIYFLVASLIAERVVRRMK
jgi:hypothetical protein